MKLKFIVFLIVLFSLNVNAQLGATKSQIIQKHQDYEMNKADDGSDYLIYEVEYEGYTTVVACYLTDIGDDKAQECYKVIIIEPSSETNAWVKSFKQKNYVKLEGMVWKDYENSVVYKVEVTDDSCFIMKYFDNEL